MGHLARGYRARINVNEMSNAGKIGLNSRTLLVIKLPDSWVLRIFSRSLFLALVLMALPSLGYVMRTSTSNADITTANGFKILPVLLRDLVDEGLIKKSQKGLVLGAGIGEIDKDFEFLRNRGIDLMVADDDMIAASQAFDFLFVRSLSGIALIDRSLKEGSIVISQFGNDPSNELEFLGNYRIVYLRRFEYTVVAMKKVGVSPNGSAFPPSTQASYVDDTVSEDEKKAALQGLEDAFLEPPTRALLRKKSSRFSSRKIKFLPDLMKDSLEGYPRRIFISDDTSALDWFYKNYPMRDQEFEVYDMEIAGNVNHNGGIMTQETGVSAWLKKNIRQKDYVVMKAEAEVVEEMLKDKTIGLVDELFLECRNQWQHGKKKINGSKRAYWQCLALYGNVRDEGIAVHQWRN